MRKSIALFCLVTMLTIIGVNTATAGTVQLQWGAVPGADGYNVYVDGVKNSSAVESAATLTVPAGEHSFHVTAYNGWGESAPSNTVKTPPLPGVPADARVVVFVNIVQ